MHYARGGQTVGKHTSVCFGVILFTTGTRVQFRADSSANIEQYDDRDPLTFDLFRRSWEE